MSPAVPADPARLCGGGHAVHHRGGHRQPDRHGVLHQGRQHRPADALLLRHERLHAHRNLSPDPEGPRLRAHRVDVPGAVQVLREVRHAHPSGLHVPLPALRCEGHEQHAGAGRQRVRPAHLPRLHPAAGGGREVHRRELPHGHGGHDSGYLRAQRGPARAAAGVLLRRFHRHELLRIPGHLRKRSGLRLHRAGGAGSAVPPERPGLLRRRVRRQVFHQHAEGGQESSEGSGPCAERHLLPGAAGGHLQRRRAGLRGRDRAARGQERPGGQKASGGAVRTGHLRRRDRQHLRCRRDRRGEAVPAALRLQRGRRGLAGAAAGGLLPAGADQSDGGGGLRRRDRDRGDHHGHGGCVRERQRAQPAEHEQRGRGQAEPGRYRDGALRE